VLEHWRLCTKSNLPTPIEETAKKKAMMSPLRVAGTDRRDQGFELDLQESQRGGREGDFLLDKERGGCAAPPESGKKKKRRGKKRSRCSFNLTRCLEKTDTTRRVLFIKGFLLRKEKGAFLAEGGESTFSRDSVKGRGSVFSWERRSSQERREHENERKGEGRGGSFSEFN